MSNSDAVTISTQGNVCFFCERFFLSEPALHKHLKTHVCDNSKPVCFCLECNPHEAVARVEEIYTQYLHVPVKNIDRTSVAYLNRLHHCKLKSFDNPIYRCPQCNCVFNGLAVFVKHMQVHAKKNPEGRESNPGTAKSSLFYCPTCRLPYRATVPYIKHLKKHLIAVIRYNGIKEKGTEYNFEEESYDNTGSLQCPVTDCRKRAKKEGEFILHMEDHLADMNSEEILQNRLELVPVKGRPPHASQTGNLSLGLPSSAFGRTIKSLDVEVHDAVDSDPAPTDGEVAEDEADEADEAEEEQNQQARDVLFCQDCDLSFDKLSTGFRHKIDVHNNDLKSCPICWRRLTDTQELIDHVVEAHDDAVGNKKKRTLDESFPFSEALSNSKEISTDSIDSLYSTAPLSKSPKTLDLSCRTCKAKHVNYSELLKHQHYVHGTTDKSCRLCNKFINSYPSLIGHVNNCKRVWFTNP